MHVRKVAVETHFNGSSAIHVTHHSWLCEWSIRLECLDPVIIFNEESLRRTLRLYFRYYHGSRLHLSLEKDSPDPRSIQSVGKVIAIPEVGGLHHSYERRAA